LTDGAVALDGCDLAVAAGTGGGLVSFDAGGLGGGAVGVVVVYPA